MGQAATVIKPTGLKRASELVREQRLTGNPPAQDATAADPRWSYQALRGRLTELVGDSQSANVSLAVDLILEAQHAGDFAAWVATHRDAFFPPDVAAAGVDLAALPVIWATESPGDFRSGVSAPAETPRRTTQGASPGLAAAAACRAAERLLRSGAFGLVVIDLARDLDIAAPSQGRLLRLAETHNAQVLILRRKREDGRYQGSLVTVRAESSSEQDAPGRFRVTLTSTKDKREGPGWTRASEFRGPPGLY